MSPQDAFRQGVVAFQKADYGAARTSFENALLADPNNAIVLFNLGLVEQKDGHNGLALGLWRKALAIRPGFSQALGAIRWAEPLLERRNLAAEHDSFEALRASALVGTPLSQFLGLTAAALLATGWLVIGHLGRRRQALLADRPLPTPPTLMVFSAILCFGAIALTAAKSYDESMLRATVVSKKVEARSSPGEGATVLFELSDGLEVLVGLQDQEWTQVSVPGGASGWVPRSALIIAAEGAIK